ncbi:unnamed protein product, partial [Laminaria digitata]
YASAATAFSPSLGATITTTRPHVDGPFTYHSCYDTDAEEMAGDGCAPDEIDRFQQQETGAQAGAHAGEQPGSLQIVQPGVQSESAGKSLGNFGGQQQQVQPESAGKSLGNFGGQEQQEQQQQQPVPVPAAEEPVQQCDRKQYMPRQREAFAPSDYYGAGSFGRCTPSSALARRPPSRSPSCSSSCPSSPAFASAYASPSEPSSPSGGGGG